MELNTYNPTATQRQREHVAERERGNIVLLNIITDGGMTVNFMRLLFEHGREGSLAD